jgi:glycosyltransferase involved in cell wall biosynthesis
MNKEFFVSVIIPVYNAGETVERCLKSVFNSDYKNFEVIIVDDKSTDRSLDIATEFPCNVVRMTKNSGAAAARNKGAEVSHGGILFFLDSDIIIEKNTIEQIAKTFQSKPEISALFCSYQMNTIPENFFSIYKNLIHHHTHQTSCESAATFCGGFGAMKRDVFFRFGGFDESYRSLEDMELGYRLYQSGYKIYLNKEIQVTHCKKYTFLNLIKSDVINRAIPWTQIILNKKFFRNDLNTKVNNVLSVPLSLLLLFNLPLLFFWPKCGYLFILLLAFLLVLNGDFYLFVLRKKGGMFTLKAILMNWFNYLYSGAGWTIGVCVFFKESYLHQKNK